MVDGRGKIKDFDPSIRKSINTGYIIIPTDLDRDQFIEQCLRTERFSILVEGNGGVLHNCYITKSALRDISFPLDGETLGSAVIFFSEPFAGKAVITGVVSKNSDSEINKEEVITLRRTKNGNHALLSVDGNGQINIDIIGTATNGALNINVRNDDFSASVNLHVKGSVNVYSEGDTNVTAIDGNVNIKSNRNININVDGDITTAASKTLLDAANQPMVKGDELQSNLEKTNEVVKSIHQALIDWVPKPKDGGAALKLQVIKQLTGKIEGSFDKIKSEKSFLE